MVGLDLALQCRSGTVRIQEYSMIKFFVGISLTLAAVFLCLGSTYGQTNSHESGRWSELSYQVQEALGKEESEKALKLATEAYELSVAAFGDKSEMTLASPVSYTHLTLPTNREV